MISQTAEYALRAIVYLAKYADEPRTTQQIAAETKVPAGYLSKVMQSLSRGGLVSSQRGLGGGFSLSKDPDELTIWEVVDAVDPLQRIRHCPLGIDAHRDLCPLHRRLDDAMALVEDTFRRSTVGELVPRLGRSKTLCRFPCISKAAALSRA